MEESEKRRERLKAMRMEAAQTGVNYGSETSGLPTGGLSNPLVESETTSTTPTPRQYPPRFDYYTDPMAAFSGNRRGNMLPQVSQGTYNMPPQVSHSNYNVPPPGYMHHGVLPRPAYQNPVLNPSGQRTFDAPRPQFNQVPPRSPVVGFRPFSGPQGNPPGAWGGSSGRYNYSFPPNLYQGDMFTNPSFVQGESPDSFCSGRGRGQRYTDNSHYYDSGRGGSQSHSSFVQGESPDSFGSGRGRGQRYTDNSHYYDSERGGSQSHSSGRGRGQWAGRNTSPGSSSSTRKGAGLHGSISAELRPDLYYSKQMVDDPWKSLTPVTWKGAGAMDSKQSWLPKSISSAKKAKVSPESSIISIPQPSLAEYLAASFNDSTNEAVDDEKSA